MTAPHWLPELILFSAHGSDWNRYVDALYEQFRRDFKDRKRQLEFSGKPIRTSYHPSYDNKDYSFWHLIQEGEIEDERTPDFRRCERIGWIRAVVENSSDTAVRVWENIRARPRGNERRILLWVNEEYLVVLGDRGDYWSLVTAYPTERPHRIEKLRKEFEAYKNAGPATLR